MKRKKKINLIILILGFLVALFIGTQTFAKYTGYHRSLGSGLIRHNNITYYNPLLITKWIFKYRESALNSYKKSLESIYIATIATVLLIMILNKSKMNEKSSHGTAKWGEKEDIREANLYLNMKEVEKELKKSNMIDTYKKILKDKKEYLNDGVILGKDKHGNEIIHRASEHIMMIAPTRSGKGVGVIIPTLTTWKHSTLVLDIKGENYELTSAYRRYLGHKCFKFSPTSEDSCSYNPLSEIRKGTKKEYDDARVISEIICQTDRPDHWSKSATDFLTGVILYIIYTHKDGSLSDIVNFIVSPNSFEEKMSKMQENHVNDDAYFNELYGTENIQRLRLSDQEEHFEKEITKRGHPLIINVATDMLSKADKERDSIISTAKTCIGIYQSPIIANNTKKSDFKIKDLMNDKVPLNLYLVTPPKDLDIISPLFRILITQVIYNLTEEMKFSSTNENTSYKHRLLLLLDEFPSIGKIPLIEKALAFIAGYGIKALIIAQDINQINRIYTKENSILSNCFVSVFYTPARTDTNTISLISKTIGDKTIEYKTSSWKGIKWFSEWNYSTHLGSRRLITEGEVATYSKDKNIIFVNGFNPIQGYKIRYYQDKKYLNRLKLGKGGKT